MRALPSFRRCSSGAAPTEAVLLLVCVALALLVAVIWMGWRLRAPWTKASARLDGASPANDRTLKDEADAFRRTTGTAPVTPNPRRPGKSSDGHEYDPNDLTWVPDLEPSVLPSAKDLGALLGEGAVSIEGPAPSIHIPQDLSDLMDAVDQVAREHKREVAFVYFIDPQGKIRVRAWNYREGREDDYDPREFAERMKRDPNDYVSPDPDHSKSAVLKPGEKGGTFHSHGMETDPAHPYVDQDGNKHVYSERAPSPQDVELAATRDAVMIMQFGGQRYALVQSARTAQAAADLKKNSTGPMDGHEIAHETIAAWQRYSQAVFDEKKEKKISFVHPDEGAEDMAVREMADKLGLAVYRGTTGGDLQRAK